MKMNAINDITQDLHNAILPSGCTNSIPPYNLRLTDCNTDRDITDRLLDLRDDDFEIEETWAKTIPFEIADAILPWQDVAPNARIVIYKKKRIHLHSADEIHSRRSKLDEANKYNRRNMETFFTTAALWRLCVEPLTYRYIPNNGRYRASKYEQKIDRDSKLARTIKSIEKLSPEQKHLQREIQKELRQEFEIQQRLDRQAEQKQRLRVAEQRRLESRGQSRAERTESKHEDKDRLQVTIIQRNSPKEPLFHRRNKVTIELPPINAPLKGKSVNENYIDNFNVRLQSLEEEMKKDQEWIRKKQQEYSDEHHAVKNPQAFRVQSEPNLTCVSSKPKSTKVHLDYGGCMPLFNEPVTEECLSVKPITNKTGNLIKVNRDGKNVNNSGENNNNNTNNNTARSSCSVEEALKTVYIKYTTSKGDVVRVPRYSGSVSFAPDLNSEEHCQEAFIQTHANGNKAELKSKPIRETMTKDLSINIATSTSAQNRTKGHPVKSGGHGKRYKTRIYIQDDPPPVIIAEGLFSRNKDCLKSENIQVTVNQRTKDKGTDAIEQGLISGVSGKGCEVLQKI